MAVNAHDWSTVGAHLGEVSPDDPSPLTRLLKGHAALATNEGDEALCMFASVFDDVAEGGDPFQAWYGWASDRVAADPDGSAAHYLLGDASARLQRWDEALSHFDRALELLPDDAMALNARGTVHAARGDWTRAMVDFTAAMKAAPDLGDAFASRGALNVVRSSGPEGARRWFDRALERSPGSSLARNGRGVASYAMADWDAAQADLTDAATATDCLPVAIENLQALMSARIAALERQQSLLAANAGTEIMARRAERVGLQVANLGSMATQAFVGTVRDLGIKVNAGVNLGTANKMGTKTNSMGVKFGVEIDPKIDYDLVRNTVVHDMSRRFDRIGQVDREIRQLQATGGPGGVALDLDGAFVDDGLWPMITFFGLHYVVEPEGSEGRIR